MGESNAPVESYTADILYAETPLITGDELLNALRERVGNVEMETGGVPGAFLFQFPDLADPSREGGQPVGVFIERGDGPLPADEVKRTLVMTRDWSGAGNAVNAHEARLVVSDLRASGLGYKNRLRIFQDVVNAVASCATPLAVRWTAAGKFVNPLKMTRAPKPGEKRDPLAGAVNVRLVAPPAGTSARMVMDTLGLAALGLPDLEVLIRLENPQNVEPFLMSIARYVFDLGDVLPDGRVVKGPAGDRWIIRRSRASNVPAREILQLRPADDVAPTGNTLIAHKPR
jgi:hypothetical protein